MNQRSNSHEVDNFQQQDFSKPVYSPIIDLRDSFRKSLTLTIGKKIPKEIEDIITIDLTPAHVEGDFTFPVFEIAKVLKVDYLTLASNIAKNLKSYKKYIREVEIVKGYINFTVKPKTFYRDSLRYVLNGNLLGETSKSKKTRTVLLLSGQAKINDLINRPVLQFINRLYALPPYIVKTASINEHTPPHKIRSLLCKAIKLGVVKDFGNNVFAIHLSQEKYALLQRQDKTPTPLMNQLTSLDTYVKKNNPAIIIFSLNIAPQQIGELLAIAHMLQTFKEGGRIVVMNDSDIEMKINSHHFNTFKNFQAEIGRTLQDRPKIDSKTSIQFKDTEMAVARLVSYAPEIFRRLLFQTSPKIIINYNEGLESCVYELYQYIGSKSSQKMVTKQLLLHAMHKILDTSLSLIEK